MISSSSPTVRTTRPRRRREGETHFVFLARCSIPIPFELTNWANLSIIFDLFGVVYTNDGGLPQNYVAAGFSSERKKRTRTRKKRGRKLFAFSSFSPSPRLSIHFPDQTNTSTEGGERDERCIKWIYFPPSDVHVLGSLFLKVMSCPKCVMEAAGLVSRKKMSKLRPSIHHHHQPAMGRKTSFVWLINVTLLLLPPSSWTAASPPTTHSLTLDPAHSHELASMIIRIKKSRKLSLWTPTLESDRKKYCEFLNFYAFAVIKGACGGGKISKPLNVNLSLKS